VLRNRRHEEGSVVCQMRLLPASYVASVRGAAHAAVRKAMLTPDALYYASDIKPAAYCNENPGGPCIVVCTNQRNATLCASRQPADQHLDNPEHMSKRARPPLKSKSTGLSKCRSKPASAQRCLVALSPYPVT